MATGILKEHHLTVDEFNQPKKSQGKDAVGVLIIRLILLEPGTDPVRPNMGLGIVSKFRYIQNSDLDALSDELKDQLNTYLTPYSNVKVSINMTTSYELEFEITIDDEVYKYVTKKQESNTNTITLSELA